MTGKEAISNVTKLIVLLCINVLLLSCNNKLLNPVKKGIFGNEQKNIISTDVYLFLYPTKFYDVRSVEPCVVVIAKKIENEFFILTKGKYEISYANLSECFVKEGEIIQRGKTIGCIRKNSKQEIDSFGPTYLRISIKDDKGNFIESSHLFK